MKSTQHFSAIILAVMLLAVLAGCGDKPATSSEAGLAVADTAGTPHNEAAHAHESTQPPANINDAGTRETAKNEEWDGQGQAPGEYEAMQEAEAAMAAAHSNDAPSVSINPGDYGFGYPARQFYESKTKEQLLFFDAMALGRTTWCYYAAPGKKQVELNTVDSDSRDGYFEVQFPNSKKIYKLKINEEKGWVDVTNPDGSRQRFNEVQH